MVTRMFETQIGKNMEAYIDDMVVKSKKVEEHSADLAEMFSILREHKLRLNASNVLLGSARVNSWGIGLLTVESKSIQNRLGLLIVCTLLGISRRCRG